MLNAAIWLGATIFCSTAGLAALSSHDLEKLVGARYFAQFSGALTQILFARLFDLQIGCALLAWLHLLGAWLYLGRQPHRARVGLLSALFALSLVGGLSLGPKFTRLHRIQYAPNARAEDRDLAGRNFRWWNGVLQAVNVLMIGGVMVYFWRITQADDTPRFVRPVNFRS